jgi:hypothetical protein
VRIIVTPGDGNMATRKSRNSARSTSARSSHEIDPGQYQQAAQQGSQQQLALAADTTSALMRGAEIFSQLQALALQRSGQTWREVAERLRTARGPFDLVGVQSHLVMNSFQQFVQLSQDFMQVAAAMQPPVAEQAQAQANAAAETAAPMMQSPMMQTPIVQAWQAMMSPMGLNGLATGAARH